MYFKGALSRSDAVSAVELFEQGLSANSVARSLIPASTLAGGPSALLLGFGSLLLVRATATLRAARGTRRSAQSRPRGKSCCHDLTQRLTSDLAVAHLGALLGHGHRDRP